MFCPGSSVMEPFCVCTQDVAGKRHLRPLRPAASLRLAPAPTGAWIITADASPANQRLGTQLGHDVHRAHPLSAALNDLFQRLLNVGEKPSQTVAEVVEPGFTVVCQGETVLWTPAVACREPRTGAALRRKLVLLVVAKATLERCIDQRSQMGGLEVPDPVLGGDKVVARVHAAVVLDDEDPSARWSHPACIGGPSRPQERHLGEELHI